MDAPEANPGAQAERMVPGRLAELMETQHWVHHVADLDSGEVLTTPLDRPVTPLSRAQRLSRLGHNFDISIFSGPSYQLTPRNPYQSWPQAWLEVTGVADYLPLNDIVAWSLPRDLRPTDDGPGMSFFFADSPDGRSVLSISLTAAAWEGTLGHVSVNAFAFESPAVQVRIPIADAFASHTVDVTFIPRAHQETNSIMSLESGIRLLWFSSVSFQGERPVFDPGTI